MLRSRLPGNGQGGAAPDPAFLERAWSVIAAAAKKANLAVVLGTERVVDNALLATALVINRDGTSPVSRTKYNSTLPRKAPIRSVPEGGFSKPVR